MAAFYQEGRIGVVDTLDRVGDVLAFLRDCVEGASSRSVGDVFTKEGLQGLHLVLLEVCDTVRQTEAAAQDVLKELFDLKKGEGR